MPSRKDTQRQRDRHHNEEGGSGQLQRRRQPLHYQIGNRLATDQGRTQVTARQIGVEVQPALAQRSIEPQGGPHCRAVGRLGGFAQHHIDRVTGNQYEQ